MMKTNANQPQGRLVSEANSLEEHFAKFHLADFVNQHFVYYDWHSAVHRHK